MTSRVSTKMIIVMTVAGSLASPRVKYTSTRNDTIIAT